MLKALVIKELRESAGMIAVAVLAAALILSDLTGVRLLPLQSGAGSAYPFVSDTALIIVLVVAGRRTRDVAGLQAIGLGAVARELLLLAASAGESPDDLRREAGGWSGCAAGDHGLRDPGVRDVGGHAGHARDAVLLVDDGCGPGSFGWRFRCCIWARF